MFMCRIVHYRSGHHVRTTQSTRALTMGSNQLSMQLGRASIASSNGTQRTLAPSPLMSQPKSAIAFHEAGHTL